MNHKRRLFCSYCGEKLKSGMEGENVRDYCERCDVFFYENPLPVVSSIVVRERQVLLVKRKNDPQKGKWCLPSGFAETGESVQAAALRELEEETGVRGRIIDFVCVDSSYSELYGDLIFITYEVEWVGGILKAGDDAEEVNFFPFGSIPELAFQSNTNAVQRYARSKEEYWAIVDSFSLSTKKQGIGKGVSFLSDKLVGMIEQNADVIAQRWLHDVRTNKSTPGYATFDREESLMRGLTVIGQFRKWMGGYYGDEEVREFYHDLGRRRKTEGFVLSEVLSAISLTRKHIWEFALSQKMWSKTIDIYMSLELERRMMIFFDRAAYYIARGYE